MRNCLCPFLSRLALPGLMSLILLSPAIARADLITTFDVSGTVLNISGMTLGSCAANGHTCAFSGMFTVDTTSPGTIEPSGLDITLPGLPAFDALVFSGPFSPGWQFEAKNSSGDDLQFAFTTAPTPSSLVGFTGGSVIGGLGDTFGNYTTITGSITPVPEPSSLALLAGVIGWLVFGISRRRRFARMPARCSWL